MGARLSKQPRRRSTQSESDAPLPPSSNAPLSQQQTQSAPDLAENATTSPGDATAAQVPLYAKAPEPPSTMTTTLSVAKETLEAVKDASGMFPPLETALTLFLKIWDVCERPKDVQDSFIEFADKLRALNVIATSYTDSADEKLQERLEAIATAINQLAEAMEAKQQRGWFARAAQSLGDIEVVQIMFRRVTSLLEVFQFETQIRAETLLAAILQRLDTDKEQQVTSVDATQVILMHIDEQHSSTREAYEAIMAHLERGAAATGNETVYNNNTNENEVVGPADLMNNNTNETELEYEGPGGGGLVNSNSNVNRILRDEASVGNGNPPSRSRIVNNNGNKNVVRRFARPQPATGRLTG